MFDAFRLSHVQPISDKSITGGENTKSQSSSSSSMHRSPTKSKTAHQSQTQTPQKSDDSSNVDGMKQQLARKDEEIAHLKLLLEERDDSFEDFINRFEFYKVSQEKEMEALESSLENAEMSMLYLRNVIYKFMSTSDVSEKKKLVPVLITILKLNREEKHTVEAVQNIEDNTDSEITGLANDFADLTSTVQDLWTTTTSSIFGSGQEPR